MTPISAVSTPAARAVAARRASWHQAAVSLNGNGHPLRVKRTPVATFRANAIADWARAMLAPSRTVFSDGLGCCRAVTLADCAHQPTVVAGRKPRELPEFAWINTVPGNLKTPLAGCYHAFGFRKVAARYSQRSPTASIVAPSSAP